MDLYLIYHYIYSCHLKSPHIKNEWQMGVILVVEMP